MSSIINFLNHSILRPLFHFCNSLLRGGGKRLLLLFTLSSGLLVLTPVTQAGFFQNTSGLSDPHTTITFGEHTFPDGTAITAEYADMGITFSPSAYYISTSSGIVSAPNFDGPLVTSFIPNGPAPGARLIQFSRPQTKAAFAFATSDGAVGTFQALLNGIVVESATAPVGGGSMPNNFYGFRDITFDAISISTNAWPAWAIDSIQVPANAYASLVSQDLTVPGDGHLTYDSNTGLLWLDLTETVGQSYNDVMSGYGGL